MHMDAGPSFLTRIRLQAITAASALYSGFLQSNPQRFASIQWSDLIAKASLTPQTRKWALRFRLQIMQYNVP